MKSISVSFISILTLIVCVFAYSASAQTSTPETTRQDNAEERKTELQARAEERQAVREEKVEERTAQRASTTATREEQREERRIALSERVQERITNLAANMSNRMDSAVARMEAIIVRVESRMDKLVTAGVDTSSAQAHVDDAKNALARAKTSLGSIDAMVATVTGSENPREAWRTVKELFINIKTELKSAHQSLRLAIAALKDAIVQARTAQEQSEEIPVEETEDTTDVQ